MRCSHGKLCRDLAACRPVERIRPSLSLGHDFETAGQFRTSMLALQKPKAYDPSSDHSVRQNVIQKAFLRARMQQTVALANRKLNNHLIALRILTARENYLPE